MGRHVVPIEVHRRFGGIYCSIPQDLRACQASKCKKELSDFCLILVGYFLSPTLKMEVLVPPKRP